MQCADVYGVIQHMLSATYLPRLLAESKEKVQQIETKPQTGKKRGKYRRPKQRDNNLRKARTKRPLYKVRSLEY